MKKVLLTLAAILTVVATQTQAQTLLHYWHFNNFTSVSGYHSLPAVPTTTVTSASPFSVHADYSKIDTSKAKIVYMTSAGTSAAFTTTIDYVIPGDTINARLGHATDTSIISCGLRPRNRSDSMELRWYIPTNNYKNIKIKYESESSSTTSGPLHQVFDYSVDSGATWKTSGLSAASDSAGTGWGPMFAVNFTTDTTVNNNGKLVFRIKFVGNSQLTSGNNRFDNITVEGDTIINTTTTPPGSPVLVHYWNFNNPSNTTAAYHNPGIPAIKADYSLIDTNKALLVYHLLPGTSSAYAGYLDFVAVAAGTPDYDSANLRTINNVATTSGNALRFRSPSDSAYLTFNIPTTGYKNITLKFAIETSNTTTSATNQSFAYSTDSGSTWKTTSLSATTDTVTPVFNLITITFGADSAVNNNAKLIFKVTNTVRLLAGNVRFDNISVDGTAFTAAPPPPPPPGTPTLVHYWHFNNLGTAYHNPGIPAFKADYSVLDTNITSIQYKLLPGTSSTYAGYIDNYPVLSTDLDTNNRTINGTPTVSGNAYRFRNPTDSAYLVFYIPSINYKNLVFSYAVMASSFTSGMLTNYYYYSLDSGATWKTSGLSEAFDTTTLTFSLKTISITDTLAYNNPRLAFKIVPQGNTSATSGNNRFDNVTLDGVAIDTSFHYHSHVGVTNVTANIATPVLFPNPAGNNVYINTFTEGQKEVVIYSIAGKKVYTAISSDKIMNINTAQLISGIYFVNVRMADGNIYNMKFVKQ